jgi:hypothetical protein
MWYIPATIKAFLAYKISSIVIYFLCAVLVVSGLWCCVVTMVRVSDMPSIHEHDTSWFYLLISVV